MGAKNSAVPGSRSSHGTELKSQEDGNRLFEVVVSICDFEVFV